MNFKIASSATIALLAVLIFSGCQSSTSPTQTQEAEQVAATETTKATQTQPPTQTPDPTATDTPEPSPTTSPTLTPSPAPTQAVLSGLVRRLCPELRAPLGLFAVREPFYDHSTDPPTLYMLYQVMELRPDPSSEPCTLYLSPPPMGDPQFAGDSLFWKSFDEEEEWNMVWKYDPTYVSADDAFPQHSFLRQTRTNTSIGKSGLFDFVVADDGETLVWSYTDPQPYDDNQMGYAQSIYGAETSGPIDQRPTVEIWFDFVPEGDSPAKIVRPRVISSDGELVYYSLEPVGLGRQWPEPLGSYTSLYAVSTWWDGYPEMLFDCGNEFWCLSDFSEEQDIVVSIQGGVLQIIELRSGELIRELQATADYPLTRGAVIGSDGMIAFLGVAMGESQYGDPPEEVAILLLKPPYQGEPDIVLRDAGLLNLLGWASPSLLLADGNNLAGDAAATSTLPGQLMLVDTETGVGTWLLQDASLFVSLVH